MNYFFNIVEKYFSLSPCIQADIIPYLRLLEFAKNEHILVKGEVCRGIYIIEKGCCRTYFIKRDKEITTSFRIEYNYICSSESYLNQSPSEEYIQAIEDTRCYFMSHENIHLLLDKYPEFNIFVRKIYEILLISETKLLNSIRTLSALERYDLYMKESPKILQRVCLGHLASYLGMSQETLSRMRKQSVE